MIIYMLTSKKLTKITKIEIAKIHIFWETWSITYDDIKSD